MLLETHDVTLRIVDDVALAASRLLVECLSRDDAPAPRRGVRSKPWGLRGHPTGAAVQSAPGRGEDRNDILLRSACPAKNPLSTRMGNSVQLFNEDFSGGLKINISKGWIRSEAAENFPLYANGIECRAREYRFGGVVVQPLEAWTVLDQR